MSTWRRDGVRNYGREGDRYVFCFGGERPLVDTRGADGEATGHVCKVLDSGEERYSCIGLDSWPDERRECWETAAICAAGHERQARRDRGRGARFSADETLSTLYLSIGGSSWPMYTPVDPILL